MTFNQFRWSGAFDNDLLKLAAPPGYELVDERKTNKKKTKKASEDVSMQASVAALDAADGPNAKPGAKFPPARRPLFST